MKLLSARVVLSAAAMVVLLAGGVPRGLAPAPAEAVDGSCPPGFRLVDLAELWAEQQLGTFDAEGGAPGKTADQMLLPRCLNNKHPELFAELYAMQRQHVAAAAAPAATVPVGAFRTAVAQRQALAQQPSTIPGAAGAWQPYGKGPLIVNDERFDSVNGQGLVEVSGRVDSLAFDAAHSRLFAIIGTGGVWMSPDLGESWTSIGDSLPSQINGAVGFSPQGGPDGTLITVGGEHLMGGNTYTGLGAFWTDDLGETWHQASGVPDEAMGFQVEVDPIDPRVVYAATSQGLYRSTDLGKTYVNVELPTSEECAGVVGYGKCQFANFVTDVVVKTPGGIGEPAVAPGTVVAAVGYRAGMAQFPDGTVHSPGNGIYRSETGTPGSFEKLDVSGASGTGSCGPGTGFPPQEDIGRTELGAATGDQQNHDYLYAIVENAELFNGGVPSIDAPEPGSDDQGASNTTFGGIYVSADFGATWSCQADTAEVSENPNTGSGLVGTGQATLFAPGVQAWYNQHIEVDPTRATEAGIPTRVTFGLEELWQNRNTTAPVDGTPQDPRGDFVVKAPYFADDACLLLETGAPACPSGDDTTSDETTAHPDNHSGLWLPDGAGGAIYVNGNDGGVYVQRVAEGAELDDAGWADGNNTGFHTLLPYHAQIANDGTVWFGLQDNGSGKIEPDGKQVMTFGGDGLFAAVDPANSDYAWTEVPNAGMRFTVDGGATWQSCDPGLTSPQFNNPFVMDPRDSNHVLTAGNEVKETITGPDTCSNVDPDGNVVDTGGWVTVFELGTNDDTGATNQMSAVDLDGDNAYVGYCGVCDILNNTAVGFNNGIATNVGGDQPPEKGTSQGWHRIPRPEGLPNRFISSIEIDPDSPETIYVTLGGYANREWVPPGSYLDPNTDIGSGNVFKSTDAGETFTNISGNLPDGHATWVVKRPGTEQLVVGTEAGGVFVSADANGSRWEVLGTGLPAVPITSLDFKSDDPGLLVAATFGRGVYTYRFSDELPERGCDPGVVPDPGFDDIAGNVHEANITCIAWYLITQGKGDVDGDGVPEYVPGQSVPRDQMASFIAHLVTDGGIELPEDAPDAFSDDDRSLHEPNIDALAALDLVEGVSAGRYAPRRSVTRAQMATFIARAYQRVVGSLPTNAGDAFTDDNRSVHEDNINALAALGIVRGVGGGRYRPGGFVGRDQMATFIANALRLFVAGGQTPFGGASVALASTSTTVGGDLSGTVTSNKRLVGLTASGCGLSNSDVSVGDGGAFTVTLPDSQAAGECSLTFTPATTNRDAGAATQRVLYPFTITVT